MPSGGHNAKPNPFHDRDGSRREDRHGRRVDAPPGTPEPPSWLSDDEFAVWRSILPRLQQIQGLTAELDAEAIARYCADWCDWLKHKRLADVESIASGVNGVPFQHPAVGIRNRAHDRLRRFESEFCMSPLARARTSVTGETAADAAEAYFD